ncbi:MAG: hypothetical protein KIT09_34270 [Bryobacteraceae bacterium]|nr:hypothetical protein [Bryobacteraceae bacterium]
MPVVCSLAWGAAFEPVPGAPAPPLAGLEPTHGQAATGGVLALTRDGIGIAGNAILYSIHGVALRFTAGNSDPPVSFIDPLPGLVNSFTTADTRNWAAGYRRYETAHFTGVWQGVDARYTTSTAGLTLTLLFRPGVDPAVAQFELTNSLTLDLLNDGSLRAGLGYSRIDPALVFGAPDAWQTSGNTRIARRARFDVQGTGRISLRVDAPDAGHPLAIEFRLPFPDMVTPAEQTRTFVRDTAGNVFAADILADAPGREAASGQGACGSLIGRPVACSDVVLYKYRPDGQLAFVTYLSGGRREAARFVGLSPGGTVVVAGSTESPDFPATRGTLQPEYAGPAPGVTGSGIDVAGDYFAALLDPETGVQIAGTFLGGPNHDQMGAAEIGADGTLYFLPKWLTPPSAGMPVSPGALQVQCAGDGCQNGYAARLSPNLERMLYGTYLPGVVQATAKLHSDGSVYYAGRDGAGFAPTPNAWQRAPAGGQDAIIARLDSQGATLVFATYAGTPKTDWILRIAVSPDGSVWASVSSFVECCVDIDDRLVHLDALGERLLADLGIAVGDIVVDSEGNLIATASGRFQASPEAPLANSCTAWEGAYLKLGPGGEQIFATYLPAGADYDFDGTSDLGLPALRTYGPEGVERFQVVEGKSMGVFLGCVVDAASFVNSDSVSPGEIVTLFGSGIGPREGAAFQFENGRAPTSLGRVRVLVNGEAVPLLYVSWNQVNAILPYSLEAGSRPAIQVVTDGEESNALSTPYVQRAAISLFRAGDSPLRPAAALNQDGSLNGPENPAMKGSVVVLFGTGGGATVPASIAGEITPLEARPLEVEPEIWIDNTLRATVEYAGAAPGLVSGVTQINARLPEDVPDNPRFPSGVVPLFVRTPGAGFVAGHVTVFVAP